MSKALVLYWSGTGNTEMMAEAVVSGLVDNGLEADLVSVSEFDDSTIDDYTHVALGCPSMGDEELEDFEFLPVYEAIKDNLSDKNVALFGSYDWGSGEWMESWYTDGLTTGANLVADGLIAHLTPDTAALEEAKELGETLANA